MLFSTNPVFLVRGGYFGIAVFCFSDICVLFVRRSCTKQQALQLSQQFSLMRTTPKTTYRSPPFGDSGSHILLYNCPYHRNKDNNRHHKPNIKSRRLKELAAFLQIKNPSNRCLTGSISIKPNMPMNTRDFNILALTHIW